MGEGYAATIPCKDVLEGPLVYFVTGFDKDNTPVANAGDKQKPFIVRVRKEGEREVLHGYVDETPGLAVGCRQLWVA